MPNARTKLRTENCFSPFGQWIAFLAPVPNPAVHRDHIGVAHLLKIVSGQRRAESSAAVENYLRIQIRHASFDVALDDAFTQMNCTGQVVLGKFAFFAHVHQDELAAAIHLLLYVLDIGFAHSRLSIVDDLQKPWRMLLSHESLLLPSVSR